MAVARLPGQMIAGEKISYSFGSAIASIDNGRPVVSLGQNGRAYVAQKWVRRTADDAPPRASAGLDELDAFSARGVADKIRETDIVHRGRHRERTGVLKGHAEVSINTPRSNVAHYA